MRSRYEKTSSRAASTIGSERFSFDPSDAEVERADLDPEEIEERFRKAVNMTAEEIASFLKTPESRKAGYFHKGESESVGHVSGRRIVRLLRNGWKSKRDLWWMRKVAGYVARHAKQRPGGDVTDTVWRYSLMNWGNDPLKTS
jgi:Protein of unknown function (DUF3140)